MHNHLKTQVPGCPLRRVPHEIGSNHLEATEPPVENVEFAIGGFCILQDGSLPVINGVITPFIGDITPFNPIFKAIYRDYSSMYD